MKSCVRCVLVACAASIGLFLDGCARSNPTGSGSSGNVILPLVIGNNWYYQNTLYDTTGAVVQQEAETLYVARDTVISGRHLFGFAWLICANADSGLIAYFSWQADPPYRDSGSAFVMYYQYPTTRGAAYDLIGLKVLVGPIDTLVKVPAGTFRCIDYEFHDSSGKLIFKSFASPGLGLIKESYFPTRTGSSTGMPWFTRELKGYKLK